jgi:hypothetical protein
MNTECIELLLEDTEDEKPPPKRGLTNVIKNKVRDLEKNSNAIRVIRMDSLAFSNILYWRAKGRKFFVVTPKCSGHFLG